jgi:hypothetical protein
MHIRRFSSDPAVAMTLQPKTAGDGLQRRADLSRARRGEARRDMECCEDDTYLWRFDTLPDPLHLPRRGPGPSRLAEGQQ